MSALIREMNEGDSAVMVVAFAAQGWNKPLRQYQRYWQESLEGKRLILLAERSGQFAGYVTIVWESDYPPFRAAHIPEIVDFNVLIRYRRMKVGTALMDEAEKCIAARAPVAGLGVCLDPDYGPAQVLYARRGYLPDGRGVFYRGRHPRYGDLVKLDDGLVLHLTKQLR